MTTNEGSRKDQRPPHRDWHGSHQEWGYRPQAFRWDGHKLVGINFIPLAREMRAWLKQRGQLPLLSNADLTTKGGYTNPFTFSGGSIALILARVVNAYYDYCTTPSVQDDPIDAEIERLRLYNEVVLYTARMCETTIKQLLYCTQFPESRYMKKALGQLLEAPCTTCKKENGKKPHLISLVGSLAHPFHLCLEFDHCALDHMALVNTLRNSQAAHSGIQTLNIRTTDVSKTDLREGCDEVMQGFIHRLSHLEKVEEAMLDDLAQKGAAIELLRRNGLPAEEANFRLMPGEPFHHDARAEPPPP